MFKIIVVGTDGSKTAQRAVRRAAELATFCSASVHVVSGYWLSDEMSVIGPMGTDVGIAQEDGIRSHVEAMLDTVGAEMAGAGVAATLHALPSRGADAILDVAEREDADLIVVGNRGVQSARPSLGAVPFNVLQQARCAVLVVDTTRQSDTSSF